MGLLLNKRGNPDAAEPLLREALELARKLPANHYVTPTNVLADLNLVLAAQGRPAETTTPADNPESQKETK